MLLEYAEVIDLSDMDSWQVAISPEDVSKKFIVDADLNPGYQMALRCVICVEDDIMETSWCHLTMVTPLRNVVTALSLLHLTTLVIMGLAANLSCALLFVTGLMTLITWQQSIIFLIKCYTFSQLSDHKQE